MRYGDFFSGFGGMSLGAAAAGMELAFAVEYDPEIAQVFGDNVGDVIQRDLLSVDVRQLPSVDVFQASPPCPRFSQANLRGGEAELDIEMARKVAEYISFHAPTVVTLENVYKYRVSRSWQAIKAALDEGGYRTEMRHINMADYGVPQTRRRMIVIARRDTAPEFPAPTHSERGEPPWVSWYKAIEDMIPSLPESTLAPWQISRLPPLTHSMIFGGADMTNTVRGMGGRGVNSPSHTVIATSYRRPSSIPVAILINDADSKNPIRYADRPAGTVVTFDTGGTLSRAVVGQRIVQMTPRCLARFQTFPDWYVLPDNAKVACRGIGNAVPPLFAEQVYRRLMEGEA